MKGQLHNSSGGRVQFRASATKIDAQVGGLQDSVARMTRQMRRYLLSLCGTGEPEGDRVVQRMRRLRQRMFATNRQITDLKYQNRARN
jgi:hypothetical protein